MNYQLPLLPIDNPALQKFCEEHNLYEAITAGYHYAKKFFPTAKKINIRFHEPYRADEPEEADIIFEIETKMSSDEAIEARQRFIKAINDIPGAFYIVTFLRFIK